MRIEVVVAAHAARHPGKPAIVYGDRQLTYAALWQSSERVARTLLARGLKVGDRVGLYLPNSAAFVELFLGVIRAGGTVVLLNPLLSAAEVRHILEDSGATFFFCEKEGRALVEDAFCPGKPIDVVTIDPDDRRGVFAEQAIWDGAELPDIPLSATDAVIGYTSGTTGKAKGAILTHPNFVVNHGLTNAVGWGLTGGDRFLVSTPMVHRNGLGRLLNSLFLGATAWIHRRFEADATLDLVERERITVLGLVPTMFRMMLPAVEKRPESLASVRLLIMGGEAIASETRDRFKRLLPHVALYTAYGMTEIGTVTSLAPDEQYSHPASVGRPTPGVEIRIVDDAGRQVPNGEVGEIRVRSGEPGSYLTMRGYYNRPDETAATIQDGFVLTGDLGWLDSEGFLYIVDRKKDMIVSGGLNIYSKEVEQALISHPAVRDAAVVGYPDATYGEAVAAFVELNSGMTAGEEDLIAHCRATIASYKKPKMVRIVERLPRNQLGKVLKYQLRSSLTPPENQQGRR